jgi:DNA-binding HxlR family transcriptional regulator
MGLGADYAHQDCSLARALEVVGQRWSLLIVRDAFYGVRRFNDFLEHLGIPRAVLMERLKSLVAAGVLRRTAYQEAPRRYAYELTEQGLELWLPVYALAQWGERNASQGGPRTRFTHDACDAPLDRRGVCTSCGEVPEPDSIVMAPGSGAVWALRTDAVSRALSTPHRLLDPLPTLGRDASRGDAGQRPEQAVA